MSLDYLKIFERFEKKVEFVKNCMAGFEEYFENFCGKLSSSLIDRNDRKKLIQLYVVGNNSMQKQFENMIYGTTFIQFHQSNLDLKDSTQTVVCENWLMANLDTFLNSSKKRKRAEYVDLKISEYGRELESDILLKLYKFQETLKLQHQFQFITDHCSLQKNAYIKQITIKGESNFSMDSNQFVSVVSLIEFSASIATFISTAVLQESATNKMMRRKVILVEDDEDTEEQNEISTSVLQYSSDDNDNANSIEHRMDKKKSGKILLRYVILLYFKFSFFSRRWWLSRR